MAFLFKNLASSIPRWKEARGGYEVLVERYHQESLRSRSRPPRLR